MEREKPENIQKVVRSVVVFLASSEEIYNNFLESEEKTPSILRFLIAVKGKDNQKRYTLLGGKINPLESFREAIQREIAEEVGITFLGIPGQTIIGQWQYSSSNSGEREVILTYNPVLPPDKYIIGDPKIGDLEVLNLDQFKKLVEEGFLNSIPLEGHLAITDYEKDFEISDEDRKKRNLSMSKVLSWMRHIEDYLRKRFEKIISDENGLISKEEFEAEYEKILSEFMRKGVEVSIKKKPADEERREERRNELIEILDGGYLGRDVLYFLPHLARYGVDWLGLEQSTEGVKIFTRFLKEIFTDFINQQGLSEEDYKDFMIKEDIPLKNKINLLNALDQFFREKLKEIFGVNDNDLDTLMVYIKNFFRDISNEMKVADPNLTQGLYQDFTLVNEVNNANFGYLLSLFLGYDTKVNNPEADELIRFEAGRQLLLLFKGLCGIKYYQEEVRKIENGQLQHAVNYFFGPILGEETIELDKNKMRIRFRKRGDQFLIVDEKPTKNFISFLRKMFEEEVERIRDFYNVNVIFPADNTPIIEKIKRVDDLIEKFKEFITVQFPDSDINIFDRRDYGTNDYILLQSRRGNQQEVKGKRKGSQGNRIVRTKVIVEMDGERMEFVIYPIYSIKKAGFWGWLEKIKDDKNYVVRRMLAGANGFPSLYDLLFPPHLYPHHYKHVLGSNFHK